MGQQTKARERGKHVPWGSDKDQEDGGKDCVGDSEISTMTSPVLYDITERTWSSATSEKQEIKTEAKEE